MRDISASFNFPSGFLWGITLPEQLLYDKESYSLLYRLQENGIKSAVINVRWDFYEPVKGNFDEGTIDGIRLLLTRMRSLNIEPIVQINFDAVPSWSNLEKRTKSENQFSLQFRFAANLAQISVSYTNYYIVQNSFESGKINDFVDQFNLFAENLHRLSDKTKLGLKISEKLISSHNNPFFRIIARNKNAFLEQMNVDFLGVKSSQSLPDFLNAVYKNNKERPQILCYSDMPRNHQDEQKVSIMMDEIYSFWRLYQEGWPVFCYAVSHEEIKSEKLLSLYALFSKNNAFYISTQLPGIPEKWIRFLSE